MGKKNYYTSLPEPHADKTGDYSKHIRRIADDIESSYEIHATHLRTMADGLKKSHGQARIRGKAADKRGGLGNKKITKMD